MRREQPWAAGKRLHDCHLDAGSGVGHHHRQAGCGRGFYSLALLANGTVDAWGWNRSGQLGRSSTDYSSTPVQVSGLSQVVAIAAGNSTSYAL
jgi:alpha-tubulin suppressor-like RCC1 family protein